MDKYAVENVRKMQQSTLVEVRDKLNALRRSHDKHASEDSAQEIQRLEAQESALVEALEESA